MTSHAGLETLKTFLTLNEGQKIKTVMLSDEKLKNIRNLETYLEKIKLNSMKK